MKPVVPYIYKLTFIPDGRVYIGSRFNKKGCNPSEFWVEGGYFTSSKHVKKLIAEYGTSEDVWSVEILEVFDESVELKDVPQRENDYIVNYVNSLGASMMLNRKWNVNGKTIYTNAGMKYKCKGISDKAKGHVLAKDSHGNTVKVPKEEFESRDDLVGLGSGMKFYHNPETSHRIKIPKDQEPPVGYISGIGSKMISEESISKISEYQKGKTFINNGEVNKRWIKGDPIPEGWVEGRLKYDMPGWTEERRAKRSETMKRKKEDREALKALEPKVEKPKRTYRKRTAEEIAFNVRRQKEENDKRKAAGIPHGNTGRKRSQESIDKQRATRERNKLLLAEQLQ